MSKRKKLDPEREFSTPCSQCGTEIKVIAVEGLGIQAMLNTDFQIGFTMLVRSKMPERNKDGYINSGYEKRYAQFCSLECAVDYCHDIKIEDFQIES